MMTKLYYFLFIGIFSVLFSCKDENKFVLEENMADIEQIITAVIEQDSINVLKNNSKKNYLIKDFKKTHIIKNVDKNEEILLFSGILLKDLFNPPFQENDVKFGFDEKDSLYLLSQNEISDTIKLPESILKKSNTLTIKEIENNIEDFNDYFYQFSLPIISKDKTKAYLEVGHFCGRHCGGGIAYFLQKQNGKWVVVNKRATWIS